MWIVGLVAGLIALDLAHVDRLEGNRTIIVPEVDTEMLGESTVVVVCSEDEELSAPAPISSADLTYEQVDAIVKRAIHLDASDRNLAATIEPGDRVVIKVNMITCPLVVNGKQMTNFWDKGTPHWGQVTDLRVVRSVVDYLINEEGDASRITIVEGAGEWPRVGAENADPKQTMDGWTVHWEAFDDLSYAGIVEEFNEVNGIVVGYVDLNYDEWMGSEGVRAGKPLPIPDPNQTGISGFQRPEEGFYVSRTLLEADKLINLAVMKTHEIPGVTMLHKQYVGTYQVRAYGGRTNSKIGLHNYTRGMGDTGLGHKQVVLGFLDLFSFRPTDYGIIEGFWGTEGNGPVWGENVNHNVVVAGSDPVAADAVAATIMGYNPEDLWYLKFSALKGFGTYDLDHIHIVGDPIEKVQRNFRKNPEPDHFWGWGNRKWLVNGPHSEESIGGEADLRPIEGQELNGIAWKVAEGLNTPYTTFVELPQDYVDAVSGIYAFTYIYSRDARDGFLFLGSEDGLQVWLNGQEVFAGEQVDEGADAVRIPVSLRRGQNPLLVRVHNSFGSAALSLVAGDEDGDTLPGVNYLLEAEGPVTAVSEETGGLPADFELGANFPNPFNPETMIPYSLPGKMQVELAIYDVRGARVRTLVDRVLPGGPHLTRWDGRNDAGAKVASGVYLYRLALPGVERSERMALVR